MDIDLIVATSGNPPDSAASLMSGTYSPYTGPGSFSTASVTSTSPHSLGNSGIASEESSVYALGTSPQSLPSVFGLDSPVAAGSSGSLLPIEPTRPYKRNKRNSSQNPSSRSPRKPSSGTSSPTSSTSASGSMESMMFGWKLSKPSKNASPADGTGADGRKRSPKSVKHGNLPVAHPTAPSDPSLGLLGASGANSLASAGPNQGLSPNNRLPFTSPLLHPQHRGFVPPVSYNVYDPMRNAAQARFQAQAQAQAQAHAAAFGHAAGAVNAGSVAPGLPVSAVPPYFSMSMSQPGSGPSSPSEYGSMLMDTSPSLLYPSAPVPNGYEHLSRGAPLLGASAGGAGGAFGAIGGSAGASLSPVVNEHFMAYDMNQHALFANAGAPPYSPHYSGQNSNPSPMQLSPLPSAAAGFAQGYQPSPTGFTGSGYASPTTTGSPRTPSYLNGLGLSPLSAAPVSAGTPPMNYNGSAGAAGSLGAAGAASVPGTNNSGFGTRSPLSSSSPLFERSTVGPPGSNGTSAFTVVAPRARTGSTNDNGLPSPPSSLKRKKKKD